jgi:hypothetical protein
MLRLDYAHRPFVGSHGPKRIHKVNMKSLTEPPHALPHSHSKLLSAHLTCLFGILVCAAAGNSEPAQNPAGKDRIHCQKGTQPFIPERAGYYDTVWPSEHTDLWRSHAVMGAGLPANFAAGQLRVTTARLNLPVWGYTRDQREVFVTGGSPVFLSIFTESIKTGKTLSPAEEALLLLKDLTNNSIPFVAKIDPKTMNVKQLDFKGGTTVNYTGGLLMHQNGFVYGVCQSVLYKINPNLMRIVGKLSLPLVGTNATQNFTTTYNGLQVVASGELVLKGFSLFDSEDIPGWLLLIDPDDLTIDVKQSSNVSSARMTIQQSADGKTWLYHVNDTQALRFEINNTGFVLDTAWTRQYRTTADTNTQASSQLLFGNIGQTAFADNTAPGAMTPIKLYTQTVVTTNLPAELTGTAAFSTNAAGFNFFMIAGDPFQTQLLVYYDPMNNLLSAHRIDADGTLDPVWEHDGYKTSASPALVPDRDLLYIDDYRNGNDYLVILKLSTGEELASIKLAATLPTIGGIVPGMNDDVYLLSSEADGTNGLISRVFVSKR